MQLAFVNFSPHRCEATLGCGAFALEAGSSSCELGKGLDLPADEIASGGKEVFACKELMYGMFSRFCFSTQCESGTGEHGTIFCSCRAGVGEMMHDKNTTSHLLQTALQTIAVPH